MSDQESTWRFEPEVKTGEGWAKQPVNARGWLISREIPTQDFIERAGRTIDKLFALLDELGIGIVDDSEWGGVRIEFDDDDFGVRYECINRPEQSYRFTIEDRQGYSAGQLIKVDKIE